MLRGPYGRAIFCQLINIHLDIDGDKQGATYPYYWVPTSGNLMYCMPKLGTRASLHIPGHDEKQARATNSPRVNGGECPEFGEVQNRAFTTEHGKRMHLYPEMLRFMGTSDTQTPLQVALSDPEAIVFESHKIFQMIARGEVRFEARQASQFSPTKISSVRVAGAYVLAEEIQPRGTKSAVQSAFQPPPARPGGTDGLTSFNAENQFDLSANQNGIMQGSVYIGYAPFDDAPKKGHIDGWKLFACVVAGLAVVAAVSVAALGVAAVVAGSAVIAGQVALTTAVVGTTMVGMKAATDCYIGEVSDPWEYCKAGLAGAVTGAMGAAMGLTMGMFKAGAVLSAALLGGEGAAENAVEDAIFGTKSSFKDYGVTVMLSIVTGGSGDNTFRAGKRALKKAAAEGAEQAAERAAKEAAEKAAREALEETTEKAVKEATEKAAKEAGEKAAKEATEKAEKTSYYLIRHMRTLCLNLKEEVLMEEGYSLTMDSNNNGQKKT